MEAEKEEIGLPVYPRAVRLAECDDKDSLTIDAYYFTSDGFEKVYAWYCEKLYPAALITEREACWAFLGGKPVRVAEITREGNGVRIHLLRSK